MNDAISIFAEGAGLVNLSTEKLEAERKVLYDYITSGRDDKWILIAHTAVCRELQKRKDA